VRYEAGFYIPEDGIFHIHRSENLKSYIALTGWPMQWRRNMSPVGYELGFYIPEDGILHSHRSENLKSYQVLPTGSVDPGIRVKQGHHSLMAVPTCCF
jgi:hypothetical protein